MRPNEFEAAMDHVLGLEDALAQNFETIRKTLDHGHADYPAYMSALVTKLLKGNDPFVHLDGELLDYATTEQKKTLANGHQKTIVHRLSEFWLMVLVYQHSVNGTGGLAKDYIKKLHLSDDAFTDENELKEGFHFGADAFAVLRDLEMLTPELCEALYGATGTGVDRWAAAIHYFELEENEDDKRNLLLRALDYHRPNQTLALALATKEELFEAVHLKDDKHFIAIAAGNVECPELWEKLKNRELFNEVFANFASDCSVTRNQLGKHLLDPDFFTAVIDVKAEKNEEWRMAMRVAKYGASDEVVVRLTEAQQSYLGEQ